MLVYSARVFALLFKLPLVLARLVPHDQLPLLQPDTPNEPVSFTDSAFDDFVKALLTQYHVPGLSLAIVDHDQILSKGYGVASFPSTPATPDTLYFTGSTTKAFTAAAAALVVQDNSNDLKWTSPVNEFLREDFVLENDYATSHITLEDALSHRSGLPRHDLAYGGPDSTPSSIVKTLRYLPMTAEPRTVFQYCNLMLMVVTDLLEKITGSPLEKILRDKFWSPLGMRSTFFSIDSALERTRSNSENTLARGYYWIDESRAMEDSLHAQDASEGYYLPDPYLNLSAISGAGAIISSVNDYALWAKAFLDVANSTKPANKSSPITSSIYHDVQEPRTIITGVGPTNGPNEFITPAVYALGWINFKLDGHIVVSHGGSLPGFGAELYLLPDDGYAVVTMGNTEITSNLVGATVALVLLQRRLALIATGHDSQLALRHLPTFQSSATSKIVFDSPALSQSDWIAAKSARLPLLGHASLYAGVYTHPAYGYVNISVADEPIRDAYYHGDRYPDALERTAPNNATVVFHGEPGPRAWKFDFFLYHESGDLFTSEFFHPHGNVADDPVQTDPGCVGERCSEKIVWEYAGRGRAVFKYGLTSKVERLGIELEVEMVLAAMRNGGRRNWEDGMIWFEKA